MVEIIANKISNYLVSENAAKEDDREVIAYGLFNILASFEQILILIILSTILNMQIEILAYSICFTTIKRYIGGFHAQSHRSCVVTYTLIAFVSCFGCMKIAPQTMPMLAIGISAVMFIIVLIKAPVPHPNSPMSEGKRKRMRKTSIVSAAIQLAVIAVGCAFLPEQANVYLLCGAGGGLIAAIMLMLPAEGLFRKGVSK